LLSIWAVLAGAVLALGVALPTGAQTLVGAAPPATRAAAPLHGLGLPSGPPFGNVLALDGSDDAATAADGTSLDLGDTEGEDFTLEAFIFVPDDTSDAIQSVFWKQNAYSLTVNFNDSTPDVLMFKWWVLPSGAGDTLFGLANLSAGWHHVAAVFDNEWTTTHDRTAIYVDGSEIAATTAFESTPGIFNSTEPLIVGAGPAGAPFAGAIEEARVSDTVRYSGSYAVPSAAFAPDASTRALWHFDEALCSKTFADSSGNGNTLVGRNGAHTRDSDPAACLPGAPTNVIGAAGDGEATIFWDPPSSDGGSSVTSYVVTPFVGATAQPPITVDNVTSARTDGLTNGTSYTFTVTAVNEFGAGPPSLPSAAVVPMHIPGRSEAEPPSPQPRPFVPPLPPGLGPRVPLPSR
jgi:hypothetical protein